ncbi:Aste57867_621 [Aphanomyces stellatus]|uniref:Aste57867_621 protein n=1 Tax=Aphanomyces stellatus TaxID=120398 RepID=A0A485K431_9STRA|nr:hypothetical protein As57867_000620 [Aphanomyces stellatus]VFT77846.1 Aste57867_621 [Aphanomyces stellatus]
MLKLDGDDGDLLSEVRAAEVCAVTSPHGLYDEDARETYAATLSKSTDVVEVTIGDKPNAKMVPQSAKQGTLQGVYFPCLQSIIGVTLFLRMPWVTSQAGVLLTCFLFVMCQSVAYLTTLSICALVTNGKVGGGGVYFLISRTIGIETGSAVGLLVYVGSTCSLAFSVLGATETFKNIVDTSHWFIHESSYLALILLVILCGVSAVGVKYISMVGSLCLAIVFGSLGCSLLGLIVHVCHTPLPHDIVWFDNVHTNFTVDPSTNIMPNMGLMIAMIYPGTTGYMAGAMRSGTLENPSKSIPVGTIAAMLTVLAINLVVVTGFGSTVANEVLKSDKLIMSTLAWPHKLIVNFGVFFAAVGGALQNLTSNPRMLAAMANDNVIPFLRPFSVAEGQEPRLAIVLCMLLTCIPCVAGNLDYLSPFLTMVNLVLCLTLNVACFAAAVAHTPGFRPQWHYFHWSTALLGALWTFGLMMFFSWYKGLIAILLCCGIHAYVKYLGFEKDWGNSIRGMQLELVCAMLRRLNKTTDEEHTKNWRPQVLVFCKTNGEGLPESPQLLHFASQLKEGHGLVEVVSLLEGKDDTTYDKAQTATLALRQHLANARISGFGHVYACRHAMRSIGMVAESSGMGSLRSNTVMVGWPQTWRTAARNGTDEAIAYVDMLHDVINCKKSIMVLKHLETFPTNDVVKKGSMDIWWVLHDGGLLLLMPYLLRLHPVWRKCSLRLFSIVSPQENATEIRKRLERFLESARIHAEIHVVEFSDSTISSLLPRRTGEQLKQKKEAMDKMNVSTMSFTVRNPTEYEQLADELNDVGTPVEEEEDVEDDNAMAKKKAIDNKSPLSTDPRIRHAQLFNRKVREYSSDAALVVLNLPRLIGVPAKQFVHYVDTVTENLPSVLLIRGSGREVVTLNA